MIRKSTLQALLLLLLLLACAAAAVEAHATTIRVGSDSSCDYYFLSQALADPRIAAGPVELRLARNASHTVDVDSLSDNVRFVGGYSNCSDQTALGVTTVHVSSSAIARQITDRSARRGMKVITPDHTDAVADADRRR